MSNDILTLREALQRWCDPSLVQRVKDEEIRHTVRELDDFGRIQLTDRALRRVPTKTDWMAKRDFAGLYAAWEEVERDLRGRVEEGQIHLRGVRLAPDRQTEPEVIARVWAADFVFDFGKGTIKIGNLKFGAIGCSLTPWASVPVAAAISQPAASLLITALINAQPEDFPDLTDETILSLLEEHARRVIKNGSNLIAPGKVSLLQIVRGKMKHRAKSGAMFDSMVAEAEWLSKWIAGLVTLHPVPTAATINKHLAKDYKQLANPRSTPAIQKLNI